MTDYTSAASRERGAAAVEFALIAPLLVLLVLGSIEFGMFFFNKANVANGAREGAREMAISHTDPTAKASAIARAIDAAKPTSVTSSDVFITDSCSEPAGTITVVIAVKYSALTGFFGGTFEAKGEGVMRCGG